jgi:two-component system, cell cycle response regulator CtrA
VLDQFEPPIGGVGCEAVTRFATTLVAGRRLSGLVGIKARQRSLFDRTAGANFNPTWTSKLAVNLDTRVVSVDDQPVRLTGKEYAILELLTLRKGTIVTREMLLNHLYSGMHEPEPKIIDVFVCKLRKKLAQATGGDHSIETVWGRGYMLRGPVPAATETHLTMREAGLSDSSHR